MAGQGYNFGKAKAKKLKAALKMVKLNPELGRKMFGLSKKEPK